MNVFINNTNKNVKYNLIQSNPSFGARTSKKAAKQVVTEISDDIFKLASAAIGAAGIATLGIAGTGKSENVDPAQAATVEEVVDIRTKQMSTETNLISRTELAKRLGINLMTVCNAVGRGDIVIDSESNLIDITNPKNSEFISKAKAAIEEAKQHGKKRVHSFVTKPEEHEIVSKADLAERLNIKLPSLIYHIQRGHIILNKDGNIDLSDKTNKDFIENYKKRETNKKTSEKSLAVKQASTNAEAEKEPVKTEQSEKIQKRTSLTSTEMGELYKKLFNAFVDMTKGMFAAIRNKRVDEVENLSVDELKLKLLENSYSEKVSANKKLMNLVEFLYGYNFQTGSEIKVLKDFVLELLNFNDSNFNMFKQQKFSQEIVKKAEAMEMYSINREQKNQARYEHIVSGLNNGINMLYANKLTKVAPVCFKYMPDSSADTEKINDASFLISVIDKLNDDSSAVTAEHPLVEVDAERERINNINAHDIEYTILGFDAEKSNPEKYKEAKEFALQNHGSDDYKYIGEYIFHSENLNNMEFGSYPEFSRELMLDICDLDKNDAVKIMSKLNDWNDLPEYEKKSFCKFCKLFSKNNPTEAKFIQQYIENYYKNCDTVIIAVSTKDDKTRIPATFSKSGKESMYKQVAPGEIIDYIEEFESAMSKLVGKSGSGGIKDYRTDKYKSHEVKTSYPARLYCYEKDFVFDAFEYYGGH